MAKPGKNPRCWAFSPACPAVQAPFAEKIRHSGFFTSMTIVVLLEKDYGIDFFCMTIFLIAAAALLLQLCRKQLIQLWDFTFKGYRTFQLIAVKAVAAAAQCSKNTALPLGDPVTDFKSGGGNG